MKVESLSCNNCGAPLEVAETTKFANCTHCGSRLSITRTGSAAYTEVLAQIGQHTEHMSGDLSAIRLHNELDRLDRDWQKAQENWQAQLDDISTTVIEAANRDKGPASPVLLVAIGSFLLLAMIGSRAVNGGLIIPVGLIIWGFMALQSSQVTKRRHDELSQNYEEQQQLFLDAEQEYNSKRADIIRRLDGA